MSSPVNINNLFPLASRQVEDLMKQPTSTTLHRPAAGALTNGQHFPRRSPGPAGPGGSGEQSITLNVYFEKAAGPQGVTVSRGPLAGCADSYSHNSCTA